MPDSVINNMEGHFGRQCKDEVVRAVVQRSYRTRNDRPRPSKPPGSHFASTASTAMAGILAMTLMQAYHGQSRPDDGKGHSPFPCSTTQML